jgi:hypothetical protein
MSVDLKLGAAIESSAPRPLFTPFFNGQASRDPSRHQMALSPDGERFLMRVPPGQGQIPGLGRSTAPSTPIVYFPTTGQTGGVAAMARGRAGGRGGGAPTSTGLIVVRNWPQGLREKKDR